MIRLDMAGEDPSLGINTLLTEAAHGLPEHAVPTYGILVSCGLVVPSLLNRSFLVDEHFFQSCFEHTLYDVDLDEDWYLERYPDVKQAICDCIIPNVRYHYLYYGYYEHRLPYRVEVHEEWYLRTYPGVAKAVQSGAFASGQEHFELHGFREGLLAHAEFSLRKVVSSVAIATASDPVLAICETHDGPDGLAIQEAAPASAHAHAQRLMAPQARSGWLRRAHAIAKKPTIVTIIIMLAGGLVSLASLFSGAAISPAPHVAGAPIIVLNAASYAETSPLAAPSLLPFILSEVSMQNVDPANPDSLAWEHLKQGPTLVSEPAPLQRATPPDHSTYAATLPSLAPREVLPLGSSLLEEEASVKTRNDLAELRRIYKRDLAAGNSQAALNLGKTYDPRFLADAGQNSQADLVLAAKFYRLAALLGNPQATLLLPR